MAGKKILLIGSPSFDGNENVRELAEKLLGNVVNVFGKNTIEYITTDSTMSGIGKVVTTYCGKTGIPQRIFPANPDLYGPKDFVGKRNEYMLRSIDIPIFIWDGISEDIFKMMRFCLKLQKPGLVATQINELEPISYGCITKYQQWMDYTINKKFNRYSQSVVTKIDSNRLIYG